MKNEKITLRQLTLCTLMCASGLSVGMSPSDLLNGAQQDFWIVVALSVPVNILICFYYYKLSGAMSGCELPIFIQNNFGKKLGLMINFFYFVFFIITTALTNRVMGNLIQVELMPTTPIWQILTPFVLVAFYSVHRGLGSIAKSSEILVPMMVVMFSITIAFTLKKLDFDNLKPILEYGTAPLLPTLSTFVSYTGFSLIALLVFYPSALEDRKGTFPRLVLGILFSCFMNIIVVGFVVLMIGPSIASLYHYPGYILARELTIGNILERSDALIVILWFFAVYVNSAIYSYASFRVGCSVFKPKNRTCFVIILAVLVSYLSQIPAFNIINLSDFFRKHWFNITFFFALVFPTTAFILSKCRGDRS